MKGLIAKKVGMTQVFTEFGDSVPVTILEAGPCVVTQVKTEDHDGYNAVQVGFGERKSKHTSKPMEGHFKKSGTGPKSIVAEFDAIPGMDYKLGQEFTAALFKKGDVISVTGTSKGKGFAGVMKRHGFSGGPQTHGQREHPRSAGSIGQASDPSRVFKGMKMAGQMGNKKSSIKNLEVVNVDADKNKILVRGSVPGSKNGIVFISK